MIFLALGTVCALIASIAKESNSVLITLLVFSVVLSFAAFVLLSIHLVQTYLLFKHMRGTSGSDSDHPERVTSVCSSYCSDVSVLFLFSNNHYLFSIHHQNHLSRKFLRLSLKLMTHQSKLFPHPSLRKNLNQTYPQR